MARIIGFLLALALLSGCGVGVLQTARPVERGVIEAGVGTGIIANDVVQEKVGQSYNWSFLELGTRIGVTDNLDVGGKIQFFPGGLLDVRYNFLPKENPLALSIRGGFGGAVGTMGGSIHIPLALGVSYDVRLSSRDPERLFTPYAHLGWSHFWFFPGNEPDDSGTVDYVDAKGHGDGVLRPTVGLRFRANRHFQLYAEYNFWLPVLKDEGDFYTFDDTHAALIGISILSGDPIF